MAVLRPQTYMNDSGTSAGPARGSLKVPLENTIVVHDEIDLPFGEIRSPARGRAGRPQRAEEHRPGVRWAGLLAGARGRRPPRFDGP